VQLARTLHGAVLLVNGRPVVRIRLPAPRSPGVLAFASTLIVERRRVVTSGCRSTSLPCPSWHACGPERCHAAAFTNVQIEFLLRRALADAGRLPGRAGPMRSRGRPPTANRTGSSPPLPAMTSPGDVRPGCGLGNLRSSASMITSLPPLILSRQILALRLLYLAQPAHAVAAFDITYQSDIILIGDRSGWTPKTTGDIPCTH
jgi:hypothetical protein